MAHHGAHHNYTCTCTHTGSHTHYTLTAKPQIPDAAFLSCHEIITDVKLKPGNVEALPLPNSNNHLYHIMSAALHGVAAGITANELKRPKTRLIGNSKEHHQYLHSHNYLRGWSPLHAAIHQRLLTPQGETVYL